MLLVERVNGPQVDFFSRLLVTHLTDDVGCSFLAHRSVSHLYSVLESVGLDAGLDVRGGDELGHIQERNRVHFDLMEEFDDLMSAL